MSSFDTPFAGLSGKSFCIHRFEKNTRHHKRDELCGKKLVEGHTLCYEHRNRRPRTPYVSEKQSVLKEEIKKPELPTKVDFLV